MKHVFKLSLAVGLIFTLFAFTSGPKEDVTGTYGVGKNDPAQIQLTLNADHTFSYTDFSVPGKKVDVTGTWKMKNDHVILIDYNSDLAFHTKWKIVDNGNRAKARKGLCFYTLCKQ